MNDLAENDVVVVQRMFTEQNVKFLQSCRQLGIKIVFDLDDNVWQVPKFNPAYQVLHQEKVFRGYEACAEWADVLTTSTRELQNVVVDRLGHLRNVATKKDIPVVWIDNALDFNLFNKPLAPKNTDKIVIGWAGSNTHSGDVAAVWDLMPEILEKYHNVYFETVGHAPPDKLVNHPRVRERQWCHISEFAARYATWNWDIVLAPLDVNKFNKSKSSIKGQESAALGVPCLMEDIAPYRYLTSKSKEIQWLLCSSWQWKSKIETLIENSSMRSELGEAMYQNAYENFNVTRTAEQWKEVCDYAYRA